MNEKEPQYIRPENLLESFGIDFKGLNEEERVMKKLLIEEYKKRQKNLLIEIKRWQEEHPKATLNDSIYSLYKELEKK